MKIHTFNKITAISALTIKQAMRSRILPVLAVILPAIIIFITLNIKGDGTVAGQISIAIRYALGIMWTIMGIATLWSGCASIAREIEDKQIRLIAVKPVKKYELWLGRWLGWLIINIGLLIICGLTLTATIHYNINRQKLSNTEKEELYNTVLVGRRRITPLQETVDDKINPLLKKLKASGEIPSDISDKDAYFIIRKRLLASRSIVEPGTEKSWRMTIPKNIPDNKQVSLKIKLQSPTRTEKSTTGILTLTNSNNPENILFKTVIKKKYSGILLINIPAEKLHNTENITITFKNDIALNSHSLVFTPGKSIELLISETGFHSNLIRTMIIILCYLAVLSALGLTASSLFYFPVASFIAIAIIIAGTTSHYFTFATDPANIIVEDHDNEETAEIGMIEKSGEFIINKLQFVVEPIMQDNILQNISDGILISWSDTGRAFLILLVLYSGILGTIGSYILSKRELAALN